MKHLYFQHANMEYDLIKKNVGDYPDTIIEIFIFNDMKQRNPDFPRAIHNTYYDINGKRWFDVGSKTERYCVF